MPLGARDQSAIVGEPELVAAIGRGDEQAFMTVVERHYPAMLTLANAYVATAEGARQIVQGAWTAALAESGGFDDRTPLRTWLLRFVARLAAPLAPRLDEDKPRATRTAVDAQRFRGGGDAFPGHWQAYPRDWRGLADDVLRGEDARRVVQDTIQALPIDQRTVITVRDVLGCSTRDACAVLGLSESAARECLHQARSQLRAALERHFDG